ncbi:N-acetyltransferase B complex non catalytic subunit-domain-containing protein [Podospora australis]|uniref:N-acetyltransferase B complex non catalytic subunit-domain-containing protein n=1 Tax=Podospora australis TaxID=1536484 RepID=A0AAN6X592_9PEZI|nr:N-acetyltransferase B complex non catalytic subunit-domain-containing protein [Podospora australis]
MSSYSYGAPALKSSVDLQLQTAWSDSKWALVVRLAAKQFATSKDPYYEAIKICAESQLDSVREKWALFVALDDLVKSKGTPDLDIIELYEWACHEFLGGEIKFAETFGPLRARWVKSNAKSPKATECLQDCLEHWDLVNSQQIATRLDKAYANAVDRRYRFWYIVLTHLLSISPQCSDGERNIYKTLALKTLQRAADFTENAEEELKQTDRLLLLEEEVCLFYRVLLAHGTKEDYLSRLQSPKLGAIGQLKKGNKLLFYEALDTLETWGEWDQIYKLCAEALRLGLKGETKLFFVCDMRIWKKFVGAATKATDSETALSELQTILKQFIGLKDQATPMYKKNISLALLETTFRLPVTALNPTHENHRGTPRVVQLALFLDQYFEKYATFDDIKGYVAELSFEEAKHLIQDVLPLIPGEVSAENPNDLTHKANQIVIKAMELKLRYLLTTCPQTLSPLPSVIDGKAQDKPFQCLFCSNPASLPCETCLKKIVVDASSTYAQLNDKKLLDLVPTIISLVDRDPRLDLALVMGTALLKLAGLRPQIPNFAQSLWQDVKADTILQAVLILDTQLKITNHNGLRLLLVQLYLLFGCASYAHELWRPMDVKRTIQDSLSPLFFDRISSISPGLFLGTRPLLEPLGSYFHNSLRADCPMKIWDAFSFSSYTSILDMAEFDNKLRTSCTVIMALVEERRARRCFGGELAFAVDDYPITGTFSLPQLICNLLTLLIFTADIMETTTLITKTDYGSFPNLESAHGPAIQEYLRIGPGLSNERSHLAFLTEQYKDLLLYKPPKDYQPPKDNPAKAHAVAKLDRTYTDEVLRRIRNSLQDWLHKPDIATHLTPAENTFYTVVSLLVPLVTMSTNPSRARPNVSPSLNLLTTSIKSTLGTMKAGLLSASNPLGQDNLVQRTISVLADMPTFANVRDTALAAKYSTAWVAAFNDRENELDKTGQWGLLRVVIAEIMALESAAIKTLVEAKGHISQLKAALDESGWLDGMIDVVLGKEDTPEDELDELTKAVSDVVGGRAGAEEWASRMVESWREGVKGWGMVRME